MAQASSTPTKRPRRATDADDNRAECPFSVRIVGPREKELKTKSKKRRKRGHNSSGTGSHLDDDDLGGRKILNQCAPFAPKGAFDTHSTMDVHYVVEPAKQWADMTRYNSFVLNNVKYYCEGFIYVANESSIERQKGAASSAHLASTGAPNTAITTMGSTVAPTNGAAAAGDSSVGTVSTVGTVNTAGPSASAGNDPLKRSEDDWVARILEIRASDEHHVYARVFWMYWPDELPAGTHYGKRQVQGRQPYHGTSELIASNHMDIINVVSVTSMASVNQLIEDKDDDVQSALYWRQALDVRNMELSSIENVCDCNQPANPDKMLVGCGDESCGKWIHEECLKHYALMRVYERLGRDKPHIAGKKHDNDDDDDDDDDPPKAAATKEEAAVEGVGMFKLETSNEDVKEPLSPRESGGAVSAQHSIDVKPNANGAGKTVNGGDNGETVSSTTTASLEGVAVAVRGKKKDALKREMSPSDGRKKSATATPAKNHKLPTLPSFDGKKKPYDKLFAATLLLTPLESSAAPTMIEITDMRTNVPGGDKQWLEPAECPACGSAIR